jgi:hypothetical protein
MPRIVIDADAQKVLSESAKAKKAVESIGDGAVKAGKKIEASLGDTISKAVLRVELLKKVLSGAGQALSTILDKASQSSQSAGGRKVETAASFAELGIRDIPKAIDRMEATKGVASMQQRAGFASALVGASRSARVPFSPEQAQEALQMFARGGEVMYGQGGQAILEGLSHGKTPEQIRTEAARKRPGLVSIYGTANDVSEELATQSKEREAQLITEEDEHQRGLQTRIGRARTAIRATDLPLSVRGLYELTPDALKDGIGTDNGSIKDVHEELQEQTRVMRREGRQLNLSAGTEKAP